MVLNGGGINPKQCGDQTKANDIQQVQITPGLKKAWSGSQDKRFSTSKQVIEMKI